MGKDAKQYVKEALEIIEVRGDSESFDDFITRLDELKHSYTKNGYKNLKIERQSDGSYEEYHEWFQLTGFRFETDGEYEKRLEKKSKDAKRAKEKAEAKLAKLKLQLEQAEKEVNKYGPLP